MTRSSAPWPRRRPLLLLILLLTSALGACGGTLSEQILEDPSPAVTRLRDGASIDEEIDRLVLPLISSGEAVGGSIGILMANGRVRTYGFGRANDPSSSDKRPAGNTIYGVGSVSKVMVATLLALLVHEGNLRYEDTVADILPPGTALSEDVRSVTLRELATHTGGLPREPWNFTHVSYFISFLFTGENFYRYIDQRWMYEYLRTCQITPKKQRTFAYSNLGFGILAHLIEVKMGRPYPQLVREKIFAPLGMNDTTYQLSAEQRQRLATGHVGDQPYFKSRDSRIDAWQMGDIMAPSGGLYTTANDMILFAKASLGLLAPAGNPLAPLRGKLADREAELLGWEFPGSPQQSTDIIFKHGMTVGYSAFIGLNPQADIATIVLQNTFDWKDKIGLNALARLSAVSHE